MRHVTRGAMPTETTRFHGAVVSGLLKAPVKESAKAPPLKR